MLHRFMTSAVLALAAASAACTVADTQPPPLAGPSEMSLSLAMSANPDTLSLDGSSQSQIAIEARDVNGQLAPNIPLRLEILVDGNPTDFGSLSARTITTGSNGTARFTYTAPTFVAGTIPTLNIGATPTGSDAANQVRRVVTIKLVPPGVIGVAPTATFTFTPEAPIAFSNVLFDGSTSTAGIGAVITSYRWDFGDGSTGSGATATHQYSAVGTYRVALTVTDSNGFSATSASQLVPVTAGTPPTAAFVFSPTGPAPGTTVFFNASTSVAGTGHSIRSYRWNFGDGSTGSGVTASHRYNTAGTWVVVLTVTDEVGQTAVSSSEVNVQ